MSATAWALPPLSVGDFAPDFVATTRFNPRFHFDTVAGRYIVLAFLPRDPARWAAATAAWEAVQGRFDDRNLTAFFFIPEAVSDAAPADRAPGLRWFFDADGAVRAKYAVADDDGAWFLLDPSLRLLARAPLDQPEAVLGRTAALPPLGAHAGVPLVAPVLIVPRVFEPELCRRLIDYYDARGGQLSGVMRDVDGRTVGVLDPMKQRRDVTIADEGLRAELLGAINRGLIPAIRRGLQFAATRLERYIVACYDAEEGGYFRAHRDNQTLGTAHRRFACSINLNAEEFEGGDVRFPEFGPRTYRPPTGGAVVFCCSLLHEATPVTRGRRYAFLPFLYDEEGQATRERNNTLIDNSAAATARTG
ncbi:2OG-Fe(II) oxygenase [Phenylobacterium sp.]|uniref:2OG-Fe(II) oxygenase n=1 Tax=Phenylobacterium sp. TaxID=1871053 RepID=UPI0025D70509|nr:2OG-Fe(II) oxygenase [Phenylobacterium sp.]MBX3486225.1 2OG-Fe(II) oxygenase [Phenylobacterium sp.]MCW5760186.1 2OG-Fe(II) oxygenase [Phenylobacterium sp.]